jgi:hypothetical protein
LQNLSDAMCTSLLFSRGGAAAIKIKIIKKSKDGPDDTDDDDS